MFVHSHTYVYVCECVYVCMCVYECMIVRARALAGMYEGVFTYKYIYLYIHIHTHVCVQIQNNLTLIQYYLIVDTKLSYSTKTRLSCTNTRLSYMSNFKIIL